MPKKLLSAPKKISRILGKAKTLDRGLKITAILSGIASVGACFDDLKLAAIGAGVTIASLIARVGVSAHKKGIETVENIVTTSKTSIAAAKGDVFSMDMIHSFRLKNTIFGGLLSLVLGTMAIVPSIGNVPRVALAVGSSLCLGAAVSRFSEAVGSARASQILTDQNREGALDPQVAKEIGLDQF